MADQTQNAANGAAQPDLLPGMTPAAAAMQRVRAGRAETLAALEKGDLAEPAAPEPTKEAAPTKAKEPTPAEPVEAADEESVETEEPEQVDEKPDPEAAKRLAAIQSAEKRTREKAAKERADLAKERAELEKERAAAAAERAEFDAWKKAKERAKLDPVAYLQAAGVDDFEYAARQAYAASKASTDPAHRETAARAMRDREQGDKLSATEKRIADLEAKLERQAQQQQFEAARSQFIDEAVKVIDDKAPLAKALGAKNSVKLRNALWATAQELIEANDGDVPDPSEVIATYESKRRAELEEHGVDVASLFAPKQNNQAADKKQPAKTLGNDLSTPRVPRPNRSDREHRAETLAMLESGRLE